MYKDNHVENMTEINTWDYGMMDFDLTDPNGFRLSFGQAANG